MSKEPSARGQDGRRSRRAALMRARYAGGRPNDEAKAIHRRYAAGPLPRLVPIAAVLDVPGRVSGATIHVPLVIVPYRAHWYLVSMLGAQANWVRNVEAADGSAVLLHGRRRPVHLVEVPVAQRPDHPPLPAGGLGRTPAHVRHLAHPAAGRRRRRGRVPRVPGGPPSWSGVGIAGYRPSGTFSVTAS